MCKDFNGAYTNNCMKEYGEVKLWGSVTSTAVLKEWNLLYTLSSHFVAPIGKGLVRLGYISLELIVC